MFSQIDRSLVFVFLTTFFFACQSDATGEEQSKNQVVEQYADFVLASYQQAKADAEALRTAIGNFTTNPTAELFEEAKTAWLAARESYGPTEAFRFYDGPIDMIDGIEGPEALINSWPMDEWYIDYIQEEADGEIRFSGIINDPESYPTIDRNLLVELNMATGDKSVCTGYHAIEFLLWGQDLTAPELKLAGQRSYTDYVDGGAIPHADRRRNYLNVCTDLLIDNLDELIGQWQADGDYRTQFLAKDSKVALSRIMTGITTLANNELAIERTLVPFESGNQEDEHSCFSDNTHRDLRLNFKGIQQVYFGKPSEEGNPSLHSLIESKNKELAEQIAEKFVETEQAVDNTTIPFDYGIIDEGGRAKMELAIDELQDLSELILAGGATIDLSVNAAMK